MDSTWRQSAGKTEEAWLAALWLGEGSIGVHRTSGNRNKNLRTNPRCSVVNTDFTIIEQAAQFLTNLGIGHYIQERHSENPKWNGRKIITISGHLRCKAFLEKILPALVGEKLYKAQLVLSLIYSRLMKPGGGRRRGGVPYDAGEHMIIETLTEGFNGNPNEFTLEWIDKIHKMYSELRRQYEEAAEMTVHPKRA